MKNGVKLGEAKCNMFMIENENWQNAIKTHVNEIPEWTSRLTATMSKNDRADYPMENVTKNILCRQLFHQQIQMTKLEEDIEAQQQRLLINKTSKKSDDIESYCFQDILRERIKTTEKAYIDLKCNFLNYLSSVC